MGVPPMPRTEYVTFAPPSASNKRYGARAMNHRRFTEVLVMLFLSFAATSCDRPTYGAGGASDLPKPKQDLPTTQPAPQKAIFAGGCFWCTEAVFQELKGVS